MTFQHIGNRLATLIFSIPLLTTSIDAEAQDVMRFEYYGTEDGLSQNSVFSMVCGRQGFLWIGTMNGLNRFDGSKFKVYSHTMASDGSADGEPGINGRIEKLWEDCCDCIWLETYDGHYRCFNERTERFSLIPSSEGALGDVATSFAQVSDSVVVVGTMRSGIRVLSYDAATVSYRERKVSLVDAQGKNAAVRSLLVDDSRKLWLSTDKGLFSIDFANLMSETPHPDLVLPGVLMSPAVCKSPDGHLWFGTESDGLYGSNGHDVQPVKIEGVALLASIGHLGYLRQANRLLVGHDHHLSLVDSALSVSPVLYPGEGRTSVSGVFVDSKDCLWITSPVGKNITQYNPFSQESKALSVAPVGQRETIDLERTFFFEDAQGVMWVGLHGGGLLRYNASEERFEAWRNDNRNSNSISSDVVHCLAQDKTGVMWAGTGPYLGGLSRIVQARSGFANIEPEPESSMLISNIVRSVCFDADDNLWVGTKNCEIFVYDKDRNPIRRFSSLLCLDGQEVKAMPYDLLMTKDRRLWIATKGEGIFVSQPIEPGTIAATRLKFERVCRGTVDGLDLSAPQSADFIYSLSEGAEGVVWAASYGGGLYRIRTDSYGRHVDVFKERNSHLLSNKVRYVTTDSEGGVWVGTIEGVNHIAPSDVAKPVPSMSQFRNMRSANSLSYNDVCYIYEEKKGCYIFCTLGGGLSVAIREGDDYRFVNYDTSDGLCHNSIYGITSSESGELWLSSENGVMRLDADSRTFENYNNSNGLAFNSFCESAVTRSSDGQIVFGGNSGLVWISPREMSRSVVTDDVLLTDIWIGSELQHVTDDGPLKQSLSFVSSIELEYWQNNITVGYAAASIGDQKSVSYSYKLDGLDKDWNYVGAQNRAIYTNLSPGKYVLHVRRQASDGLWASNSRDLVIEVLQPWWKTKLAISLYLLVFGAIAVFVFQSISSIRAYRGQLKLEKAVNKTKLEFFTNIAHEIRTPLTLIVAPISELMAQDLPDNVKSQMSIMQRNANRMLKLVSRLLDFNKVQNHEMHLSLTSVDVSRFVQDVAEAFRLYADNRGVRFVVDVPENLQRVWMDVDEMDTVVHNLLSNAFKFTPNGKSVSIRVVQDEKNTRIVVSDEGRGIKDVSPDVLFKRFTILSSNSQAGTGIGLSLSYELVRLHKGELTVESEVGKGSQFTISLLNGRRHFEGDPMVSFEDVASDSAAHRAASHQVELDDVVHTDEESLPENPESELPVMLIVEDNADIRNYLAMTMRGKFRCHVAGDGAEGLAAIRKAHPDIVVTDLMMPNMDGQEMIRHMRENFETSHTIVVALSAKSTAEDQIDTYNVGADAFVPKPFNVQHLMAVCNALLRRRKDLVNEMMGATLSTAVGVVASEVQEPVSAVEVAENGVVVGVSRDEQQERQEAAQELIANSQMTISIPAKDEEFLKDMIRYAEDNYKQNLSVEQFAEHFNMSRTVFYNKVKGLTGKGPLDFVRQIKFKLAADLLRKGYNVSEAAFEIGYSDVKYFSKQFKQFFGYSPSQEKRNDSGNA